jgi:spore germination cell wall hydrolase CwlJ-like protein
MQQQIENQALANAELQKQINQMNVEMEFYKLDYNKQQAKMREVDCLAKNIYFEAGSETHDGKIAVAEVTMNRVKSGFAKTVCGVVKQKVNDTCQFSWYCKPSRPINNQTAWFESNKIAKNILLFNKKYGIIGDARFFHADYVTPTWTHQKEFKGQIGNHLFYR